MHNKIDIVIELGSVKESKPQELFQEQNDGNAVKYETRNNNSELATRQWVMANESATAIISTRDHRSNMP